MPHTFSICTPTPFVQFCKNYDLHELSKPYYSVHIGHGLNYTFIPNLGSECKTTKTLNTIVTTCPGVKTTLYVPTPTSGVASGGPNASTLHTQLDLMQNILSETQKNASVSLRNFPIESNISNGQNNTNEFKCKCCGCCWQKDYVLKTKFYICQMCSTQHIFSPYDVSDLGPFENASQRQILFDEIQKFQKEIYQSHPGYWRN